MPMTEGDSPPEPQDFAKRLHALRSEVKQDSGDGPHTGGVPRTAAGWVMRLSVELAAGLVVGGLIGWGLDYWLGMNPLLLIVFFLLGATAGIYNGSYGPRCKLNRDAAVRSDSGGWPPRIGIGRGGSA
jgi:ATP synthase protein I